MIQPLFLLVNSEVSAKMGSFVSLVAINFTFLI